MIKYSHVLLIGILLAGCTSEPAQDKGLTQVDNPHDGLWQNVDEVPFRFVLEQTWGVEEGPEEQLLSRIGEIQVDVDGNIYILNNRAGELSSFNAQGGHRWTVGRIGQGPGEFNRVSNIIFDGSEHILIFNRSGSRIDRFTLEGEYVDSHSTEMLGHSSLRGVGMLNSETLVAKDSPSGILGIEIVIISMMGDWSTVTSYIIDQSGDLEIPTAVSFGPDVDVLGGLIVNSHVSEYMFEFRDTTGVILSRVTRNVEKLSRPGFHYDGTTQLTVSLSSLETPLSIGGEYYVAVGSWPTDPFDPDKVAESIHNHSSLELPSAFESTIDLFNGQFELLYALLTPDNTHQDFEKVIGSDSDGKIYAIMNTDFPQIGRFRVEVTPPLKTPVR